MLFPNAYIIDVTYKPNAPKPNPQTAKKTLNQPPHLSTVNVQRKSWVDAPTNGVAIAANKIDPIMEGVTLKATLPIIKYAKHVAIKVKIIFSMVSSDMCLPCMDHPPTRQCRPLALWSVRWVPRPLFSGAGVQLFRPNALATHTLGPLCILFAW